MFCDFCKKFENSKWPPFLARQNFFENWHGYSAEIPCGSKISSKSLYLARFSRYKHFYVLQFLRKIRKFKMATIFARKNFFENWHGYSAEIPGGSNQKFRRNHSSRVFEILAFLCFAIFAQKFENSKWPPFLARQIFLKIGMATLQRYPEDQKFCRNRSIWHGFRDISIFIFCNFCEKFENSPWNYTIQVPQI